VLVRVNNEEPVAAAGRTCVRRFGYFLSVCWIRFQALGVTDDVLYTLYCFPASSRTTNTRVSFCTQQKLRNNTVLFVVPVLSTYTVSLCNSNRDAETNSMFSEIQRRRNRFPAFKVCYITASAYYNNTIRTRTVNYAHLFAFRRQHFFYLTKSAGRPTHAFRRRLFHLITQNVIIMIFVNCVKNFFISEIIVFVLCVQFSVD